MSMYSYDFGGLTLTGRDAEEFVNKFDRVRRPNMRVADTVKRVKNFKNKLNIRAINQKDDCSSFAIDKKDEQKHGLELFIKKQAKPYEQKNLCRTHVYAPSNKVLGYISLINTEICLYDIVEDYSIEYWQGKYPCASIPRLAVHKDYQKKGIGKELVNYALQKIMKASNTIGIRFVMVYSDKKVIKFYEKCGFKMLDARGIKKNSDQNMMFFDVRNFEG